MNYFFLILKGVAIGVANIIPGVSGGTMAVVLGIYERLIHVIGTFINDRKNIVSNIIFLGCIGFGAICGILGFAKIIEWSLANHNQITMLFFMGLIAGSLPVVIKLKPIKNINSSHILFISLGILIVLLLGGSDITLQKEAIKAGIESGSLETNSRNNIMLLVAGILAGGAMIVPGVSGSLALLLIGEYKNILTALNERDFISLAFVGIGVGIGILFFAKLIDIALRKAESLTHMFIIGLVGGSMIIIFKGFPEGSLGITFGALFFILGCHISGKLS